jgi:hypothetical protein
MALSGRSTAMQQFSRYRSRADIDQDNLPEGTQHHELPRPVRASVGAAYRESLAVISLLTAMRQEAAVAASVAWGVAASVASASAWATRSKLWPQRRRRET